MARVGSGSARKTRLDLLAIFAILWICAGCQSLDISSGLPGLSDSKNERQIVREAKHDPFPSPSDVGMSTVEK